MGLDSWWLIQSLTSGTYTKEQEKGLAGHEEVCVGTLEQMVIDLIQEWGVLVSWSPHAAVWVQKRKIYTMGVNNSNMVNDMTSLVLVLH